jgi:sarcosine oxidase subunit gamma
MRRYLEQQGATWRNLPDAAVAESIPAKTAKRSLTLTDLSPLPRLGFKGRGTVPAMAKRGITLEAKANQAYRQADGSLCLVLAPSEVILLSNLKGDGERLAELEKGWRIEDEEPTYPLLRRDSHAWFLVTGHDAPAMFAKIAGIDFRLHKFSDLAIAQTSVAKMTAIVTRADFGKYPAFHLLADSAAAIYFWSCLTDAAREFGGSILGLGQAEEFETHEAADGGTQL